MSAVITVMDLEKKPEKLQIIDLFLYVVCIAHGVECSALHTVLSSLPERPATSTNCKIEQ